MSSLAFTIDAPVALAELNVQKYTMESQSSPSSTAAAAQTFPEVQGAPLSRSEIEWRVRARKFYGR